MHNVTVDNLSFIYSDDVKLVLQDISTQVESGEFVCLLGQSGCGKSTFLRLLAGLEKPTKGSICIDGQPIQGASLSRSVVFQDYGLFPWMTAGENIMLALKQKFPKKKKQASACLFLISCFPRLAVRPLIQAGKHHIITIISVIQGAVHAADRRRGCPCFFRNIQIRAVLPQHPRHLVAL